MEMLPVRSITDSTEQARRAAFLEFNALLPDNQTHLDAADQTPSGQDPLLGPAATLEDVHTLSGAIPSDTCGMPTVQSLNTTGIPLPVVTVGQAQNLELGRLAGLLARDGIHAHAWLIPPGPRPVPGRHAFILLITDGQAEITREWVHTRPAPPSLAAVMDELLTDARTFAECDTVFDYCVDHTDYDPNTAEAEQRWAVLEVAYSDAVALVGDRWGDYAYADTPAPTTRVAS